MGPDPKELELPPVKISSHSDIEYGLSELLQADKRLVAIHEAAGEVPLRLSTPDYSGLVSIIISQQVSKASAAAIFGRLVQLADPLEPATILRADDDLFRQAGISRPKQGTLIEIASAVDCGELDLERLCDVGAEKAIDELTAIKGVGPWTAEVYLMFCAGHRDIFPAGDLALQEAVRVALNLNERPDVKQLRIIAEKWAPWRSIASRLFWSYYRVLRSGRDALPF
ncbi:MAG: DNA-3-methyladenine glycosylase family protein [Rhizobiaceae bacterium]